MSLSRRHFIQLSSISLLAGAVLPAAIAQDKNDDETFSAERIAALDGISRQDFEPYIGERFAISQPGRSLGKLTLIEVRDPYLHLYRGKLVKDKRGGTGSYRLCVALPRIGRNPAAGNLHLLAVIPGRVSALSSAGRP